MKYEPGQYYHVYNRGNNRQEIFLEEENYRFFLRRLHHYFKRASVPLLAYCLMPTHFHLLIKLKRHIDFSNVMRSFGISYVRSFNRWHGRSGHLFEGDFQSRPVDSDEYLSHLCRYIHLNPVNAGLARLPERWPFSDYSQWVATGELNVSPAIALRQTMFGSGEDYRKFVMDFEDAKRHEARLVSWLFG